LAITLAAARVNTLGPAAILKRLPQRFRILRGRDTTLRKAIALSWELLDEWERDVLGQCIVFQGGFTVEAAEEVVRLDDDAPWVVDVLGGLVEKSLLRSLETEIAGEVRFEILASIREFVAQHAEADAQVQQRHGAYYLDHCRQLSYATRRSGGADARVRLAHEQHNLLAALDATEDPSVAADLALLLDKLFRLQGTSTRWERVLGRALETTGQLDGSRLARLRRASGEYLLLHGRFDESATALEDAIEVASASGEDVTLAWTHFLRGELERRRGRPSEALDHLDAAIEIADDHEIRHVKRMALGHRAGCLVDVGALDDARDAVAQMERLPPSDDLRDEANLLKRVAYAQYYLGNLAEQRRLTREALELARAGGDHRLEATCIQGLGDAAFANGDYDEALSAWGEALELHRAHGSAELEGALLGNLGNLYHRMDRLEEARVAYRQALKLHAATGAKPYEAVTWFGLGVLELEQGHLDDAAAALRTAADLNEAIGNQAEIGSCRLVAAWVAQRADIDAAALLDEARRAFEKADEDDWAALVDASRSAQPASSAEDPVVQLCIRALQGEQVDDRSRLHVRAALARSSAPEDQPVTLPDLRIARDASWFETDDERIDLRRRRAPRHILARLVELRCKAPEATLDVQEAFEVGWPGEIATASAASDRVYWAIRTLRKLGLEDFLITGGEGYLLAPDAAIAIED
jgi:tetratricopeptide (TPR) repeat protein